MKLTFNILLSLLFKAKRNGKGRIGKGRFYVRLMSIITGYNEKELLGYFGNDTTLSGAYRKLERFICRFEKDGKGYPFQLISMASLRSDSSSMITLEPYIYEVQTFCEEQLDKSKINDLIYTLLEIIRQDNCISKLLYGTDFIEKEKLTGSYAHPSSICLAALLIALIYYTHTSPAIANSDSIDLYSVPERRTFRIIRYSDVYNIDVDAYISLSESLFENAQHPSEEIVLCISNSKFNSKEDVLRAILLKYRYQGEYRNWHDCCACEGESSALYEISELERLFCSIPIGGQERYMLMFRTTDIAEALLTLMNTEWQNTEIHTDENMR